MPEKKPINRDWNDLAKFYDEMSAVSNDKNYGKSMRALAHLCNWMSTSEYSKTLYGFTSLHKLNMFQMPPIYPECLNVQHLALNPSMEGTVEFTFIDTFKEDKQWKRCADKDGICKLLESFMLQVGWIKSPIK